MSVYSLLAEKRTETDVEGLSIPSDDVVARTIDYAAAKGINEIKIDGFPTAVNGLIEEMKTYAVKNYGVVLENISISAYE